MTIMHSPPGNWFIAHKFQWCSSAAPTMQRLAVIWYSRSYYYRRTDSGLAVPKMLRHAYGLDLIAALFCM